MSDLLLSPDGWIRHPDFIRIDGVADKVYSQPNSGENGLACHSIVGEEPDNQDGIPARFLSREKNPDGSYTKNAAASCTFILRKRAKHVQMHPVTASTWTTGSRGANTTTWAMEAEGGPLSNTTEPLTRHQEDGFLTIATAWEQLKGRRLVVGETVRAHWQWALYFGAASTACESGRYRNAWARLTAGERYGDDMAQEHIDRLARVERLLAGHGSLPVKVSEGNLGAVRLIKGSGTKVGDDVVFSGLDALAYLDLMGNNFWLGLAATQSTASKALKVATGVATALVAAGVAGSQLL